jgi:hypothetical protein
VELMRLLWSDGTAFAVTIGVFLVLVAGVAKLWFLLRRAGG